MSRMKRIFSRTAPHDIVFVGMSIATLVFLAFLYAASDKIPYSNGYGLDGREYGEAAEKLFDGQYVPDQRIIRRVLPSAAVNLALSGLGITLGPANIVAGFIALNLICVGVALFAWRRICAAVQLSPRYAIAGIAMLAWSFALFKWNAYYPVLTDTMAFAIGALAAWFYLRGFRVGLLVLLVASCFTWQTGPYLLLLLLALPVRRESGAVPVSIHDGRARNWLLVLAVVAVFWFVLTIDPPNTFPTLNYALYHEPLTRIIAYLALVAYVAIALRAVISNIPSPSCARSTYRSRSSAGPCCSASGGFRRPMPRPEHPASCRSRTS